MSKHANVIFNWHRHYVKIAQRAERRENWLLAAEAWDDAAIAEGKASLADRCSCREHAEECRRLDARDEFDAAYDESFAPVGISYRVCV